MGFFKNLFRRRGGSSKKDKKAVDKGATFSKSKSTERDFSPEQDNSNGLSARGPDFSVGDERVVLSPRNNAVPHFDEAPPHSPGFNRSTGPVDLDDESVDNENAIRRVDLDLLPQQKHVFSMPPEESKIRFSAGQLYSSDNSHSDGESSSFNLSTDAEDTDYENLRRRGVLPPTLLDTSTLSVASNTPTTASQYHTDEGTVFPELMTDDDATRVSTGQPRQQEQNLSLASTSPSQDSSADDHWNRKELGQAKSPSKPVVNYPYSSSASPTSKSSVSPSHGSQPKPSHSFPSSPPSSNGFGTASRSSSNGYSARNDFTSSKSSSSSPPAAAAVAGFDDNFANFADFNNVSFPSDPIWSAHRGGINSSSSAGPTPAPAVPKTHYTDTSLSELLAQAKSKSASGRARRSGGSVNSAPALSSASYIRQHHNLKSTGSTSPRPSLDNNSGGASVSDIIRNLEAANATRPGGSGSVASGRQHQRTNSRGDDMSAHSKDNISVRSAKERLRRRREGMIRNGGHSSDSEENEASETWLVDEVTGALGPRGIAADLESLSGRSNRSRSSGGGRSHKSHRSHRSHRSSSRRQGKSSGGDSISSHGSRRSRYSHRSTRSYISQMSEQSRSVANDLLRLEMQLAMVGSGDNAEIAAKRAASGGSVGGNSRRSTARTVGSRRSSASARRTRITVLAPPGKLGIILANKADGKGTVVSGVRTSSVMAEKISPGDRIVAIDGEDVSLMTVSEITTIMARKSEFERTLTVLTTPRNMLGNEESPRSPRAADYDYRYRTDRA